MTTLLIIILIMLTALPVQDQFAGGSGTEEDPYQVETLGQLQAIADTSYLDKHFIQIADIDASETVEWSDSLVFEPIGWWQDFENNSPFTGSYDGSGFAITDLHIDQPNGYNVGLFGYIDGAVIKNVALKNGNVSGNTRVGGTCRCQQGRGFQLV